MNEPKAGSWLYFFLGLACFLIPGVVAVFIVYDQGVSFIPVFMFAGIVIWGGLFWLFPFTFGKLGKGKKKVSFDERDQLIHKKAIMVAYVALWLYFVAACVIACITAPAFYILYRKKSYEAAFDEREKAIDRRAFSLAVMDLTIFLGCVCIIPYFILGGQNVIKVFYLPLIFICSLFAAQFVHSMAILIQCSLEEEDG